MSWLYVTGKGVCSVGPGSQEGRTRKVVVAALTLLVLLVCPPWAYADPLGRKGLVPVTDESCFFVDDATLYEPYVLLDPKAAPLDLSRLLNERKRFPTMHFILEGDRRVIGIRTLAMGPAGKELVLTWSEDLTLLLPPPSPGDPKTKSFEAVQIVGLYSAYGKEGMRTMWAYVASDGTVTVSTIDRDSLEVSVDLMFKRVNVDPFVRLDKDQKDDAELISKVEKETSAHALINIKRTYVVHRKAYHDLTFWEGRAGDVDISDRYKMCSRCFYDPETWDMFIPKSGKK